MFIVRKIIAPLPVNMEKISLLAVKILYNNDMVEKQSLHRLDYLVSMKFKQYSNFAVCTIVSTQNIIFYFLTV